MSVKKEKVEMQDVRISELIDKQFYTKLTGELPTLDVTALVFIDKKTNIPLVVSHQSEEEINKKVVHLDSKNEETLDTFIRILQKEKR
jgi:hypothetical protein